MFFEGSEKKAEIIVDASRVSLLADFDDAFWSELVNCCDARILSKVNNKHCKAYLLSESSLFVWNDRLVILTCGQTRLVLAILFFLNKLDQDLVLQVIYQRKNEHLANAQHSSFIDDAKLLQNHIPGQSYLFGDMHGHHQYVYHHCNNYQADGSSKFYELLFYQISGEASQKLMSQGLTCQDIRAFFDIEGLLPDFVIDDHVFEPFGYSLNAIKDEQYFTIHVTPQSISSYVGIESNLDLLSMLPRLLKILSPLALDLICYNENHFNEKVNSSLPANFICKKAVEGELAQGFNVNFANYILPNGDVVEPVQLDVSGETDIFRFMD